MSGINLVPVFMIGLLGGVHCVGMCGGIVGAFSAAARPRPPGPGFPLPLVAGASTSPTIPIIPIIQSVPATVSTASTATTSASGALARPRPVGGPVVGLHGVVRVLAYNTGRIGSYGIAGALAGGIAGGAQSLTGITVLQIGGYWLANLMLVLLGLYLMDVWRGLTRLEAAGQMVWQRIRPLMQYLLPLDSPLKALALGGVWGWLPCGMVYSVLVTAMLSGSAGSGALVMLAFGLGTLPTLLTMGLFGAQFKGWAQRRPVRVTGGLLVLGFGVLGLVRAAHGLPMAWLDGVCVSPLVTAGGL